MTSLSWADDVDRSTSEFRSLLADRGGFFSSNPLHVSGDLMEAPVRLLAAVLLELRDRNCSRFVLLEEGLSAPGTGRWRFPGGEFSPGELPLPVALRAVAENLILLEGGLPRSWAGLEQSILSVGMDLLPELRLTLTGGCQASWETSLVFTYHARVEVQDVHQAELRDVTARHGPNIWLAGILDIEASIDAGTLCPASEQLWKNYWKREDA